METILLEQLARPRLKPAKSEKRQTFIIPDGYEAVRDENGRATGEVRPNPPPAPNVMGSDPLARAIGPESSWRCLDLLMGFFREGVGANEHQETYGFMWRAGVRTAEEARDWLMEKDDTMLGCGLRDSLATAGRVISIVSPYLCHGVGCSANDLDYMDHSPCTCGLRKLYNPKGISDPPPAPRGRGE